MRFETLTFSPSFSVLFQLTGWANRGNGCKNVKCEMLNKRKIQRDVCVLQWEKMRDAYRHDRQTQSIPWARVIVACASQHKSVASICLTINTYYIKRTMETIFSRARRLFPLQIPPYITLHLLKRWDRHYELITLHATELVLMFWQRIYFIWTYFTSDRLQKLYFSQLLSDYSTFNRHAPNVRHILAINTATLYIISRFVHLDISS